MDVLTIIVEFLKAVAQTAQFRILVGLIFFDVILAMAAAWRTGSFDWTKTKAWLTGILWPYILAYLGAVIVINFIVPANVTSYPAIADAGLTEWLNAGMINFAWLTLVGTLGQKIITNGRLLYGGK